MNKKELTNELALRTGYTKTDCMLMLDTLCDIISETLSRGERIKIANFGVFKTKKRAARTGKNFADNKALTIPSRVTAVFVPGERLKNMEDVIGVE